MVTLHYFLNYFVLLVLQSSVFLYAQESSVSSSTSLPEPLPTVSADIDKESFPVLTGKENVPSLNPPVPIQTPQLTSTDNDKTNTSIDKEFPQLPQNGQRICVLNETRADFPAVNTNAKNASDSMPKAADPEMDCNNITTNQNPLVDPSKIDTELPDLLSNSKEEYHEISDKAPKNFTGNQDIDDQVELIDDDKENTEEFIRAASQHQVDVPSVPLLQGQLAAILAAVFVAISVIAYFALLSWRRYLENRYGNREMLVNEDELNDGDMRHFSI